jgi:hypothetical protein
MPDRRALRLNRWGDSLESPQFFSPPKIFFVRSHFLLATIFFPRYASPAF